MELLARLQEDMKQAMKAGQKDRLSVIRMLVSDVKNIDLMPNKPTAEQAVEAYAKKLRKSAEEYQKLGKTDELDKLKFEISVVEEYLPKKLDEQQTAQLIDAYLQGKSFTEKQFGQAMGGFMREHGGNVDAGVVSRLLKARLNAQ